MRTSLCLLLLLSCLPAQDPGRLDAARITSGEFASERFGPARWLDGGHYATLEADKDHSGLELVRYDAVSGKRDVLVDIAHLRVAGREQPLQIEDYRLSDDGQRLLVFCDSQRVWRTNTRGEYFVLDVAGTAPPRRLGGALPKSTLMFAKFAPHGDRVAYVASNDLYVEDLASGTQTRLTADGSKTVINGTFDWVYEEEFFCQDGFRWSPDGTRIAYWQLDCSGVGEFLMIDNLSDRYSKVEPVQYPKAGTQNSSCRIGVVSASGGETVWMKTEGDPREAYLPRMEWHPWKNALAVLWLPRAQNETRLLWCDAKTGKVELVRRDLDPAYLDAQDLRWLPDVTSPGVGLSPLLWTTEQGGWRGFGVQVFDAGIASGVADTFLALPLGAFDVIGIDYCDRKGERVFFAASPDNATQRYLFGFEAGTVARITPKSEPGWHDYQISTDGSLAIHTYSHFDSPPVIDLVKLPTHEPVRVLVDNNKLRAKYAAVQKGRNEFFRVKTEDGIELDGWAMYPPDFDATKSWPVVFHVYGEPWAQTVMDRWNLSHHLFHRWLTQQGYVVMSLDARGTPAPRGRDWRKALYQKIGITSSHDWDQGVRALCGQHSWMDKTRLAIWGWSGGGAMTLNMLFRYPDLFAAGMSVAPVTDIALYDTIYQERYCGDPRLFPDVYRECSAINFAKNLKGKLLLVHGTGDDNVHYQNSERLVNELVAQGKLFEFLAYPNRTHSIGEGKGTRAHLYGSLADFLLRRVPAGAR